VEERCAMAQVNTPPLAFSLKIKQMYVVEQQHQEAAFLMDGTAVVAHVILNYTILLLFLRLSYVVFNTYPERVCCSCQPEKECVSGCDITTCFCCQSKGLRTFLLFSLLMFI
jgi:hypothetical protein